jgi:hypothetical protein
VVSCRIADINKKVELRPHTAKRLNSLRGLMTDSKEVQNSLSLGEARQKKEKLNKLKVNFLLRIFF